MLRCKLAISVAIIMESMFATFAKIEGRKNKNWEAIKKAQNKKDQYMKDLMNQKSFLDNDIKRKHKECAVIK